MTKLQAALLNFGRKFLVFIIVLAAGIVMSWWMPIDYYSVWIDRMVYLAAGFFVGNVGEHIASAFKKTGGPQ